ncbi:MAG: nicotinate-nucleotide adenylyltransferase [Candidatus Obscuribacter phosphatis]|uniref:Probable nicotinate-nucleotide adenylyltransferase n=1 Tax=Candidatus Obscuribacter phosphatis TaxID=1906157 RepID=A0A8J7TL53_9BACT|nr:nicotinate-nucleotide adenylyltransferase [Candidatus Obscuribacter phosphatis]
MQEIGLFCGTFNPVHLGHLLIAEAARSQFALDKVIFVVSPHPPHRNNRELLDGEARYSLLCRAIAENQYFQASDLELKRQGKSYTIDTVESLEAQFPDARISLIIGSDNLKSFDTWHRYQDLAKQVRLLVVPRLRVVQATAEGCTTTTSLGQSQTSDKSGSNKSDSNISESDNNRSEKNAEEMTASLDSSQTLAHYLSLYPQVELVDFPGVAISASEVRKRIKEGKSVLYMVPPAVCQLIDKNGYYKVPMVK